VKRIFVYRPSAAGQIELFQLLLLDVNFLKTSPDPTMTMTKIPYQTSTQMLQKPIPVIASQYRKHTTFYKGANLANCIKIKPDSVQKNSSKFLQVGCSREFVPNLLLTNVMSLVPKMDELEHVTKQIMQI
jgi:hypothetical protein